MFINNVQNFSFRYIKHLNRNDPKKEKHPLHSDPLFINTNGGALYTSNRGFDFTVFRDVTGLTSAGPYMCRHLFSNTMYDTNQATLIECEQYATGHSSDTARQNYISDHITMMKAATATDAFREMIGMPEDNLPGPKNIVPSMGEEQEKLDAEQLAELYKEMEDEMLEHQEEIENLQEVRSGRVITEKTKVNLLTLIVEHHYEHQHEASSSPENLLELFFSGEKWLRRSQKLKVVILRLLDTCPLSSEPRCVLYNNLIEHCRYKCGKVDMTDETEEDVLRELEIEWTERLIRTIDRLREAKSKSIMTNKRILKIFTNIARKENNFDYCLGSKAIINMVEQYFMLEDGRAVSANPSRRGATVVPPAEFAKTLEDHFPPPAHQTTPVKATPQPQSRHHPLHPIPEEHEVVSTPMVLDAEQHGYMVEIDTGVNQVRIVTGPSPVKITPIIKTPSNDGMKRQILKFYCLYAPNPLARAKTPTGKSEHMKQLKDIHQQMSIMFNGESTRLTTWKLDTLAQFFQLRGFTGQKFWAHGPGLIHVLDKVLEGKERTKEVVRQVVGEVMDLALKLSDKE